MKHAVNKNKSAIKAKTKTLTQNKAVKKTKPTAKKPTSKIAANPRRQTTVQKNNAVVKSAPKKPVRVVKPAIKKTAPKLSAKTLNALKTISARKTASAAKQTTKSKTGKVAPKTSVKTVTTPVQKTKKISPIKKVSAVKKKLKTTLPTQKAKPKTLVKKTKVSAKASVKPKAKTSVKSTKTSLPKVTVQTAKVRQPKVKTVAITKIKAAAKKPANIKKSKQSVSAKPIKQNKIKPIVAAKKVNRKKNQPIIAAKNSVKKIAVVKPIVKVKKVVKKTQKPKLTAAVKKRNPKIEKPTRIRKVKVVENVIETTAPRPPKPRNRKARPISSAVFRGKKEQYDFKVFALDEKFEPIPAVYIISKRKIDRRKKGHHALVCIGQTDSVFDELKRHRKGKCVKKHEANAVSILHEADEQIRLKIETDLKAAHAVACVFE
ncbi:MAG: hypothetical protein ACR2HG_11045 [Pyrinomonadaceae bacterium]